MKRGIVFSLLILFLMVGVSAGLYSEDNLYGQKITNITITNIVVEDTNSTDFWDGLDTPADITTFLLNTGDTATGDYFITNGNGLVVGHTSKIDFGAIPEFQVVGNDAPESSMAFVRFQNVQGGATLRFLKSRSNTIGVNTIVQDGDELGRIRFQGADSNDFNTNGAEISAEVDGTPGVNDLPGRIIFSTTNDGSSSVSEKMRITNAGLVGIGTKTPQNLLNVIGTGNFTGNIIVGTSASPQNITMFSPDGTSYSCGVTNGGTWACV